MPFPGQFSGYQQRSQTNTCFNGQINLTLPNAQLIPIFTSSNSPGVFQSSFYQRSQTNKSILAIERRLLEQKSTGVIYGFGFPGASLLDRILMSLQCGIGTEERWALGALVEMSFSANSFWTFKDNDVLTTTLLKRLASDIRTESGNEEDRKEGCFSTRKGDTDTILPFGKAAISHKELIRQQHDLEALLVLRNMAVIPENAQYLANSPLSPSILIYEFDINNYGVNEEHLHYCIELLGMASVYMKCNSFDDPLFQSVIKLISAGEDWSTIVPALRSMSRLLIRDEANICKSLPNSFIPQIIRYLLTTDYELITASLDFLYQYTAHPENISMVTTDATNTTAIRSHLIRLLTFGMKEIALDNKPEYHWLAKHIPDPAPETAPELKPEVLAEHMTFTEPDCAAVWTHSCYEPNLHSEVTQISLWKTYEAQFKSQARADGTRLLPAVEFIRNVAATFRSSQAVVSTLPNGQKCL